MAFTVFSFASSNTGLERISSSTASFCREAEFLVVVHADGIEQVLRFVVDFDALFINGAGENLHRVQRDGDGFCGFVHIHLGGVQIAAQECLSIVGEDEEFVGEGMLQPLISENSRTFRLCCSCSGW